MSDGFLGRWSKRKLEVKQGKAVEAQPPLPPSQAPAPVAVTASAVKETSGNDLAGSPAEPGPEVQAPQPLTLEDVKTLTPESDFKRFAAADVTPEVKNAAMKKLFADPRYNVMDGMDVYIDDYSKPDPMPQAMLRQLATAKFLGLFREEEKQEEEAARQARDVADNPDSQKVAQSQCVPQAVPEPATDADTDLQLQQDHAAPGEDPGRGTG